MPALSVNIFARVVNFLCPGVVQLYQGNYRSFILLSALPLVLIFSLSWSKLIFTGLALFYLPIAFLCAQIIAAFFIPGVSSKKENRKRPIFFAACVGWSAIWYGLLYFTAINKSWLLGFDLYRVASSSMEPTLFHGEYVLADTSVQKVSRSDIVFFQYQPIGAQINVKRVLALTGDSVKVRSSKSPALLVPQHQEGGIKIREREFFVTGDNVAASFDSREFGAIPASTIKGKAMNIYKNKRWVRIINTTHLRSIHQKK
ncbi:MAG: hypothetical protein K0R24_2228 [Gammaproteobacteria bacterium]|jgi:signal peptidase I|nr:hypothetical protein [Gammaproteobacteria bacterium]